MRNIRTIPEIPLKDDIKTPAELLVTALAVADDFKDSYDRLKQQSPNVDLKSLIGLVQFKNKKLLVVLTERTDQGWDHIRGFGTPQGLIDHACSLGEGPGELRIIVLTETHGNTLTVRIST